MKSAEIWRVSSAHRARGTHQPAQPFDTWHARRLGDRYTACGQPAIGWPIFWEVTLAEGRDRTCPDCLTALYGNRVSVGRPSTSMPAW
jgi:hypothetical protein